jgi:uncharacterized membrane protein YeaQ/YmgE (transglycosylase-associated protein family)
MALIVWIVLGLISGFAANPLLNKNGEGPLFNIVVGATGAVIGGYLVTLISAGRASGLDLWSVFAAVAGAVVFVGIKQAFLGSGQVRT